MLLGGVAAGLAGQNAAAGATAAENETLNNRVLHSEEKPLTRQLADAANAKGITNADGSPLTATDVANQLAQMGYRQADTSESGAAATVKGDVPPNDGTTWWPAGVDSTTGQKIWAQVPGPVNPALQSFIIQTTNAADVPAFANSYTASAAGAQLNFDSQSSGSSAGSICPNGDCGIAYRSIAMPSPATVTDQASTALALAAIWLPPPYDGAALVGSAAFKSLNYLYGQPSSFSILYDAVNAAIGAVIPQGRSVQTMFTLGTTAAQPYVVPQKKLP